MYLFIHNKKLNLYKHIITLYNIDIFHFFFFYKITNEVF